MLDMFVISLFQDRKLAKTKNGANVGVTLYKQIVGSLMYLTTTRPVLMFVCCKFDLSFYGMSNTTTFCNS